MRPDLDKSSTKKILSSSIEVEIDDLVAVFTSGIPDIADHLGTSFGTHGVEAAFSRIRGSDLTVLKTELNQTIEDFCNGKQITEDITLLCFKIQPQKES